LIVAADWTAFHFVGAVDVEVAVGVDDDGLENCAAGAVEFESGAFGGEVDVKALTSPSTSGEALHVLSGLRVGEGDKDEEEDEGAQSHWESPDYLEYDGQGEKSRGEASEILNRSGRGGRRRGRRSLLIAEFEWHFWGGDFAICHSAWE
jgi:hypothetical protein